MASVQKDSRGFSKYWYACFTSASGKRRIISTRTTDRKQAQQIADAWQKAERLVAVKDGGCEAQVKRVFDDLLESAGFRTVEVIRLQEWLTNWLDGKRSLAPSTRKAYRHVFDVFLKFMGPRSNTPIEMITEVDIARFVDSLLKTGLSNSTIDKITKHLNSPFSRALLLGKIKFNPVRATESLPKNGTTRDVFSPDDVARLIRSAPSDDWKGMIILGYSSALRLQDDANLEWSGIDTENGLITFFERKKKKYAVVGLHADFQDWLLAQNVSDDQKFVFPTLAGRTAPTLSRHFSHIMKDTGIVGRITKQRSGRGRQLRSLTFHSLRHSAVTSAFNVAAAQDIARKVSGHAGGVIRTYIHPDAPNLKAAVNLIPRLPHE
jgi:integrase